MNVITRINGRKIIPVSDNMKAIFRYGEIGFPCQLYHDNISNFHENNVNWHWQGDLEFSIIKRGQVELQLLKNKYIVKEGEGYLIFPDCLHRITKSINQEGLYDTIIVNPNLLYGKTSSIIYHKYYMPIFLKSNGVLFFSSNTNWGKTIFELFELMVTLLEEKPVHYEISVIQQLSNIWKELLLHAEVSETILPNPLIQKNTKIKIRDMLAYIHKNYENTVLLEDIASVGKVSKGECCQIFKKYVHTSPIKYLMEYRIEQSIPLLLQKDKNITEAALSVGFNCINHYINTFKKIVGTTPYQYKKKVLVSKNNQISPMLIRGEDTSGQT